MDKKYQVFVSSTYKDLEYERREVIQGLLEINCIPIAMELFPAADDDQWTFIERLIDDCDYYVVIVGGRYGSLSSEGISYTRKEYEYAVKKKIPVVGFLPKEPEKIEKGKTDREPDKERLLEDLKKMVQQKLCRHYANPHDLRAHVITSMTHLMRNNPRPGWVKSDTIPEAAAEAMLALREKIEMLEEQLSSNNTQAPKEAEGLQQGQDKFILDCEYTVGNFWDSFNTSQNFMQMSLEWDHIFYIISPLLVDEASEGIMQSAIENFLKSQAQIHYKNKTNSPDYPEISRLNIDNDHFQTIKIQFSTLGLIEKSKKKRGINDKATYWKLTNYGEKRMMQLRALRKENTSSGYQPIEQG